MQGKDLIKSVSYFYYALPNKVNNVYIPLEWRLYNIEKSVDYVVWYHFYLVTARQILEILPFSLEGKKVLDLGSTPVISCLFAMLGAKVTVVDIDENEIKKAQKLAQYFRCEKNMNIIHQNLFEVKYENEFDLVYNCGVIEHFTNSVSVIKIMTKCAKINGYVMCLVPSFFTLHTLLIRPVVRKKRKFFWDTLGDIPERSYTATVLKKEMELAGLQNIKTDKGNIVRNLLDDHIVNYFVNKFKCKYFVKKIVYTLCNICDFIEYRFTFIKKLLGWTLIAVGNKLR